MIFQCGRLLWAWWFWYTRGSGTTRLLREACGLGLWKGEFCAVISTLLSQSIWDIALIYASIRILSVWRYLIHTHTSWSIQSHTIRSGDYTDLLYWNDMYNLFCQSTNRVWGQCTIKCTRNHTNCGIKIKSCNPKWSSKFVREYRVLHSMFRNCVIVHKKKNIFLV